MSITSSISDFTKQYKVHILCWLIFAFYEIAMTSLVTNLLPSLVYFLFYSLNIGLFYFHSAIVLKRLYYNRFSDILYIPFFTILELAVYFFITYSFTILFKNMGYSYYQDSFLQRRYLIPTLYRGMTFILYGTGYYFLYSYYERKEKAFTQAIENEKLKNELLRAEQDFLRAQINPHLLFNTLSFIKYAAKKNPEEADQAVMRLSGIMSFALDSNTQTIKLTKELEQVENIIELNQLRFNHKLNISYTKQLHDSQVSIIPIVLLTLVENIFKHGNLSDEKYPAKIFVQTTSEHIILQTSNLQNRNSTAVSHNKGLLNIRSRLDQAYKNRYEFHHETVDNLFKVYIKIKIQNN
ncbi:Histidine kinase [Pedobacter westerhofensis]|uniref:Histidine kinase n=2 Tax=Pedobacter westerhofensis TaxID=425512 RepID=A0A521EU20_9SPHI|nr:Histidine kinase [Pedobacter westerhofensis]